MKKLTLGLFTALLLFVCISGGTFAAPDPIRIREAKTNAESAEVIKLQNRLKEIECIDKSELNSIEKRALRKEVRSIDKRLRQIGGGVYISVGTLLLIVILLLIFL